MSANPAFVSKTGEKFYCGEIVRAYTICGPTLKEGESIPPTSAYSLVVEDGQILFSPEQGWYKFYPDDKSRPSRFLGDIDKLEKL